MESTQKWGGNNHKVVMKKPMTRENKPGLLTPCIGAGARAIE